MARRFAYRFGLDLTALCLFLILMAPNLLWFAVPAPNDLLRAESAVPLLDGIGTAVQVISIIALCLIRHQSAGRLRSTPLPWVVLALCGAYYSCWGLYYGAVVNWGVLLGLAIFPCAALLCYAAARKNYLALIPLAVFTICHVGETVIRIL